MENISRKGRGGKREGNPKDLTQRRKGTKDAKNTEEGHHTKPTEVTKEQRAAIADAHAEALTAATGLAKASPPKAAYRGAYWAYNVPN